MSGHLVFDAGRMKRRVHLLQLFAVLVGLVGLRFVVFVLASLTRSAEEGGALHPVVAWVLAAMAIAVACVALAVGLRLHARHYVLRLVVDEPRGVACVTFVGFLRPFTRELPLDALSDGGVHGARAVVRVHAPWYLVRVAGRRWPMILDTEGDWLDAPTIARHLLPVTGGADGALLPWPPDGPRLTRVTPSA